MSLKITRKSDHIKILESDSANLSRNHGYRCLNCKEQYQLIANPGDEKNNLKCLNCGALTPRRTVKHGRGLAVPSIQQEEQTAIVQTDKPNIKGKDRRPKGIHSGKKNELEESLISKGFQVTDSQVVEPV
jgi:DNA-directed RNA polymerase subunit RPC12/RpoP